MKKISLRTSFFIGFIFSLVLIGVLFLFFRQNLGIQEEKRYDSSSIVERIADIQELSVIEYHYTSVIGLKSSKKFQEISLPFTGKSFLATYDGVIKAGIEMDEAVVKVEEKKVHITIPKAKITNHNIDENSLLVYDESKNILNPIKIEDYNEALRSEKSSMEEKAKANGILTHAEERAVLLLRSLLMDLQFEDITVEISDTN
ncbi:MAG: DUF4230 domain-containing protein [Peptostreptococcaceae bacterium]|nr:DUF4230 domain-containing protein [Peptostreptococcaceae bacterium]